MGIMIYLQVLERIGLVRPPLPTLAIASCGNAALAAAVVASSGHGDPVRLDPAKSATATFGVSETGNYTPSTCAAKSAQSLSVGLAKTGNWWVKLPISVCTKLTSTTIWGVVPAGSGAVP